MRRRGTALAALAIAVALVLPACGDDTPAPAAVPATTTGDAAPGATAAVPGSTAAPAGDPVLRLEPVASGFEQPVFYTTRDGDGLVVDQPGVIWLITPDGGTRPFLDIRDRVKFGGEQGLLGLAFHPDHPDLFYVDYTAGDGATTIAEFTIVDGAGDPGSERRILEIEQPAGNHNGGMIAFGPDGDLWIGMGDGGGGGDRYGNGQRGDTLLGAMLRITVGPDDDPYAIPPGNEFAAPEVWAIGLRNPWRFSFDGETVWIADVGQGEVEEIDRAGTAETALNFGWPVYEGTDCFDGPCDDADASGRPYVPPVSEYRHDEGCSITGGYVYRGAIPGIDGHYFFSDWCTGFIRSIAPDGTVHDWSAETGNIEQVTSFGRDEAGEVYVVSGTGTIYRIAEETG